MDGSTTFIEYLHQRHGLINVEPIGRGGMGEVFRASRPYLNDQVAVKRLSADTEKEPQAQARFENEMRTLASINCAEIVRVIDGGITDNGDAYYTMDYVEGKDLGKMIRERQGAGQPFTIAETVRLLRPIASALNYLHFRISPPIIHRDVKPANILVPSDGNYASESLLTDFGVSLVGDGTRYTSMHVLPGTPKYHAPELYPVNEGGPVGDATKESDNYALAVVALEMLTLRSLHETMSDPQWRSMARPFPNLREMGLNASPEIGDLLDRVFRKALDPRPGYRFARATEFINALEQAGQPPRPRDASARSSASGRQREGSWITVGILSAVALLVAGAVGYLAYVVTTHNPWSEEAKVLAATFPGALPSTQDRAGPDGTTCTETAPDGDQLAVITCEGEELAYEFLDYGSAALRDAALDGDDRVGWEGAVCSVESVTVDDDSVAVLPDTAGDRFAITITGAQAEQKRLEIPLC